jgi:hypothetical protein
MPAGEPVDEGRALAEAGGWDAAVSLPIARVFPGLASVAFTALLVRGTVR